MDKFIDIVTQVILAGPIAWVLLIVTVIIWLVFIEKIFSEIGMFIIKIVRYFFK